MEKKVVSKKAGMTEEDLDQVREKPELKVFAEFYDKLQRKMELRERNRKLLERLKDTMGKIHHELDDLKKKQNEKPRAGRVNMSKTGPIKKK